jgi:hypothetical protein
VADDDHVLGVNDDRLAKAKLADRGGDGVDGVVVDTGILGIGLDIGELPQLDLHASAP